MKFSIEEYENLYPFEAEIFLGLFRELKEKEKEQQENGMENFDGKD